MKVLLTHACMIKMKNLIYNERVSYLLNYLLLEFPKIDELKVPKALIRSLNFELESESILDFSLHTKFISKVNRQFDLDLSTAGFIPYLWRDTTEDRLWEMKNYTERDRAERIRNRETEDRLKEDR